MCCISGTAVGESSGPPMLPDRCRDADVQLMPALRLKANIHVKALAGDGELLAIGEAKLPNIYHPVVVL